MSSYIRLTDVQDQVMTMYREGRDRGESTGFKTLDRFYRVKKGCTTYVTGTPGHGKTHFTFELLLNLTQSKGWKHLLFTPETGSDAEIVATLTEKYTKKKFDDLPFHPTDRMTEREAQITTGYLSQAFFLCDQSQTMTVDKVLNTALEVKKDHGLDTIMIDPWNELSHDFSQNNGREDKYLEYTLGKIRRFARDNDVHVFIDAHPKTLHKNKDGQYEPATAWDISGGAPWFAKGESIICVYRPDETNVSQIIIQKVKPAIIGKKGTCELYYDIPTGRYYEEIDGRNYYAFGEENRRAVNESPIISIQSQQFEKQVEVPF